MDCASHAQSTPSNGASLAPFCALPALPTVQQARSTRAPHAPDPLITRQVQPSFNRNAARVTPIDDGFELFWTAYPKKVAKEAARRAWQKLQPSTELQADMVATLAWQRQQDSWIRDDGRYVPNPATWLLQCRWQDEPSPTPRLNDRTLAIGRAVKEFLK
jgi:hypothetical protein